MPADHDASAQTRLDMIKARKETSIDVVNVRQFIYNGREEWRRKEKLVEIVSKDPVFDKSKREWMTRTEKYTRGHHDRYITIGRFLTNLPPSFEPVFLLQASQELLDKYGGVIASRGIFGCYLQTELGHGSNVAALETTASYIPQTKEFEIHSPTLTSSKWWIGALGKTATHGVVQAQLILPGGLNMGPHLFFVQLRSLDTHELLPGIIAGDIGPKSFHGFAATDNGFARFFHIRIPKEHMLSKFAQVTDDGKYVQPPHTKISYGGMLYIRSGMVTTAGWVTAKAAVIAIRYATVRRQGTRGPDGLEKQVITYPSLHIRLLPILARAYVFIGLGRALSQSFQTMVQRLSGGDTSLLAEMHATTSGLKILCTTSSVQDMENARRSMGGHGYSAFSGIGRLYADVIPSVTYEGENFVLDQQVVRAALKAFHSLFGTEGKGRPSPSTVRGLTASSYYLRLLSSPSKEPPFLEDGDGSKSSWNDFETLILLLEWRAALLVHEMAQTAHDPDATLFQRVSRGTTEAFVGRRVGEMINDFRKNAELQESDVAVLSRLYLLYLQTTIESALADFLSFGLLRIKNPSRVRASRDPTRGLRLAIARNCLSLVPEAVGLTDALGFSDWELDSTLGMYDGNVYQALWDKAQTEPLNDKEIPDAYEESIKPMLTRGQQKLTERKWETKL
ncbi:acyl- oxidase [Lentinula edodes]|uniref:Acyl-coenzyme A oxidase n=1 Tax=Lentinula edodes TaxID=5353 RepID=A0A1Q3EBP4_LENED|nr:acyl- oxidase [Lentinula edodes]